ncbi:MULTISPECIES: helix-turn-helix transcriptional regulator [unclassified Streptomyces]|uniref:ArsR/SmtB family transcription factor n=1 Tax=unclassified Streptomyces TaxID=2593676 RepID=UPI000CD4DD2F|nr:MULTISPECIES: helix-turn-helix domain-containing protein [unclassified Streptomyces]
MATSPASAASSGTRVLLHPTLAEIRLERVLHALSDPVRLRVVRALAEARDGLPCSLIDLPVSKSTTTHHFRVLRQSGVVRQQYRGTAKINELRRDELDWLFPGFLAGVLEAARQQEARPAPAVR